MAENPEAPTPLEEVLRMKKQGLADAEIVNALREKGYKPTDISDALSQSKIKAAVGKEEMVPSILKPAEEVPAPAPEAVPVPTPAPAPAPAPEAVPLAEELPKPEEAYPYPYPAAPAAAPPPAVPTETIEEITEEVVAEKWEEVKEKISDVIEWKSYADSRISTLGDRVKRIETSMDRLQAALLGKVQEYGQSIKDLGAEIASLETAFSKVLSPLIDNIKALSKITKELKTARPKSAKQAAKPAKRSKK